MFDDYIMLVAVALGFIAGAVTCLLVVAPYLPDAEYPPFMKEPADGEV